jgi:DNA primase
MSLVEGLFDMLNLHDKGLECAVCCFGTQKLSPYNIVEKLTPYMIQGVQKIYLMFDNDEAGIQAAEKIKTAIELKTNLLVDTIDLPEDCDPGDLTQTQVNYIKKIVQ